jgi:hypothetical protein
MARRSSRRAAHAAKRKTKSRRKKQPTDKHIHQGHGYSTVNAPKHW